MSNIQTYLNETLDVKVRTVLVERVIWFCGADVAKALGYVDTADAVKTHCKSPKAWSELQGGQIAGSGLEGTFSIGFRIHIGFQCVVETNLRRLYV